MQEIDKVTGDEDYQRILGKVVVKIAFLCILIGLLAGTAVGLVIGVLVA